MVNYIFFFALFCVCFIAFLLVVFYCVYLKIIVYYIFSINEIISTQSIYLLLITNKLIKKYLLYYKLRYWNQ